MIRFLLALAAIYFIYWLVTKDSKSKAKAKQRKRPPPSSASSSHMILDEMKRCPTCDTFNPKSYAYFLKGAYYCDAQCAQKRKSSS